MDPRPSCGFFLPAIILIVLSTISLSDAASSSARTLLQETTSCPLDFETMNYTAITTQCKLPIMNVKACCDAYKAFVCPIKDYVNNSTTVCAQAVFSALNAKGNFTGGFFGNLCSDAAEGTSCPAAPSAALSAPPPAGGVVGIAAMFLVWGWIWV